MHIECRWYDSNFTLLMQRTVTNYMACLTLKRTATRPCTWQHGKRTSASACISRAYQVDNLHHRAGSTAVWQMHGALDRALCAACGHRWTAPPVMTPEDPCPKCAQAATRPDVVWFGEMPYFMDEIWDRLRAADLFVSIGTSGNVYPAAAFVQDAARSGADTLELNLEPSSGSRSFAQTRLGKASEIVPDWVEEILRI